jgi:hypothetical protein
MHLGHRRRLLMLLDGPSNQLRRDGFAAGDRATQRVLHCVLAVSGRQLQNLQVFTHAFAWAMVAAQLIVGHAEVATRKHVFTVLVVLERARLADQRIDHVTVIDRVLAMAGQTWHPLDFGARVEDVDEVGVDHHVHPVPDQPTGHRIRVAFDLNRTAAADRNAGDALPVIQLARRQLAKTRFFLGKPGPSRRIALVDQPLKELFVLFAVGEVAASTQ